MRRKSSILCPSISQLISIVASEVEDEMDIDECASSIKLDIVADTMEERRSLSHPLVLDGR